MKNRTFWKREILLIFGEFTYFLRIVLK